MCHEFLRFNKTCEYQSLTKCLNYTKNDMDIVIKKCSNPDNPSDVIYKIYKNDVWLSSFTTPERALRYIASQMEVKVEEDISHPLFRVWYKTLSKDEILNKKSKMNKPRRTKETRKLIW